MRIICQIVTITYFIKFGVKIIIFNDIRNIILSCKVITQKSKK